MCVALKDRTMFGENTAYQLRRPHPYILSNTVVEELGFGLGQSQDLGTLQSLRRLLTPLCIRVLYSQVQGHLSDS